LTARDPAAQLELLPGVIAAAILDTPNGPLVYLATAPGSDHEALLAVVLALLQDYGLPTDPNRVYMGSAPSPTGPTAPHARTTLDSVDVHRAGLRVQCTARLRSVGRLTTGLATEPDTPTGRARAAARATLKAAESLDADFRFGLEGVLTLDLFGQRTVVVLIDGSVGRARGRRPGAALVDRSVEEAAALAALYAVRGWLT